MSQKKLKYGVIGLGPVGSTVAACLQKSGKQVEVLCGYDQRFQELKESPLFITGAIEATEHLNHLHRQLDSFLAQKLDIIFIATKTCDSPALLRDIKRIGVSDQTVFVSCQNGLDVENYISDIFGSASALRMVINIGCRFLDPHKIHVGFSYTHFLSDLPDVVRETSQAIAEDLCRVGFKVELRKDYKVEVFKKVIMNSTVGTLCSLSGLTMHELASDEHYSKIVREMVSEDLELAKLLKLEIPRDFSDFTLEYAKKGGNHKPSMLHDIENKRPTENEDHCGRIIQYANKLGLKVPYNSCVYYQMRALEKRATKNLSSANLKSEEK